MSRQRTLDLERARAAWDRISAVKGEKYCKEYGQLAKSAPADIQTNGLGQTLSFWRAKGRERKEYLALYRDVSDWLKLRVTHQDDLLEWITQEGTTSSQYRQATAETMTFLVWLKRFSEAELGGS